MKRKRDIQGKFTLKDDDYRQVRSLRLTDATWTSWGIAAECLGLSRADLLESLVKENQGTFPSVYSEKPRLKTDILLNKDELNKKVAQVLAELRLGKQAANYKLVQKSLNRLIELILSPGK
ncbi:MAG: hypothetical protein WBM44_19740 [Waterburya sp.]